VIYFTIDFVSIRLVKLDPMLETSTTIFWLPRYRQKNIQRYQCINHYKFCMNVHTKSRHQIVIPPLHAYMMKHPPKAHVTIIDRPLHTLVSSSYHHGTWSLIWLHQRDVTRSRRMCMFIAYLACVVWVWERTTHIPGHGKSNMNGPKIPGLGVKSRLDCWAGLGLGFKILWFLGKRPNLMGFWDFY
jgi:hypothetical protein